MNYILVKPQPRGQITIPKKLREKYGIEPGVPIKVSDTGTGVHLEPLQSDPYVIPAKFKGEEARKVYAEIAEFIKTNGPIWTEEDEVKRLESRKKDGG